MMPVTIWPACGRERIRHEPATASGALAHVTATAQSQGETTMSIMSVERSTMRKVYWRLLPPTLLVYFLCYLYRVNVGFAALTRNKDLGLDAATYGMAAGSFFWGYYLSVSSGNFR